MTVASYSHLKILILTLLCSVTTNWATLNIPQCASWNKTGSTMIANLSLPSGLFIDTNDILYVADTYNHRVVRTNLNNITQTAIVAGTGTQGSAANELDQPLDIVVDSNGSLYIADTANYRVQKYLPNATSGVTIFNSSISGQSIGNLRALAIDRNETLYIFDIQWRRISSLFPLRSTGNFSIPFINTPVPSALDNFFVNDDFTVYVTISNSHKIQQYGVGSQTWITVVDGSSSLSSLTAIMLDTSNRFYIVDYSGNGVIQWSSNPALHTCIAGCSGASNGATEFGSPIDLAFDSQENLYVCDYFNNRIQRFSIIINCTSDQTTIDAPEEIKTNVSIQTTTNTPSATISTSINENGNGTTAQSTISVSTTYQEALATRVFMATSTTERVVEQTGATAVQPPLPGYFVAPSCNNSQNIGSFCNISITSCDMLNPCQNLGTCVNTAQGYSCSCDSGFNGTDCELNMRPCTSNTCWNNGTCLTLSSSTFSCLCSSGWQSVHCETLINFCENVTCLNNGMCRTLLLDYQCQCLDESYSGRYCEVTSDSLVIHQYLSKSFAYVAIAAIAIVITFVVTLDVLKYCFGIDPVGEERERIRKKRAPAVRRQPRIAFRPEYISGTKQTFFMTNKELSV